MEDVIQMENNVSMPHFTIMQARENPLHGQFFMASKVNGSKNRKSVGSNTHSLSTQKKK